MKRVKNDMKNWLIFRLSVLWGKYFSLDKIFRRQNAVAKICFVGGEKLGGSIKLIIGGTTYFFEGSPEIEEYKNYANNPVVSKTLKYGGWEMDLKHFEHKI